ncbi:NUDIX hydrolase [Varunaivibrio sulfuroxidans]|uniref:ADP-ribose pyrophosphatase YjhB (NUDIX family) n=1 Tax=Varunaivibrio sulfuroxidans TaxID=1773489 RepID=A0A4R3JBJ5_9PROT|nr:CoA pyrophosphatase [Varunaivibrio sulfuroxidans]TCS62675.1 ADP-ribose pyrophosphatase YjhB (NUDIX family) [Varunaivibrio sulfuroxidans]WES30662.1 CoA pyrophosphatase [Varunaivibrio sulfuroxidans]
MTRVRIKKEWLVRHLKTPSRGQNHGLAGDRDVDPTLPRGDVLRDAAVLIAIVQNPRESTILLTRRTDHLAHHPGQISFPGGRLEDGESPAEGALREAWEETGLDPHDVDIIGRLDTYVTGTGFSISPIVALVKAPLTPVPDPFEVAEIFEAPLSFLMDPTNHKRHDAVIKGVARHYHAIPYGPYYIWGATASILINLYRRLA